MTSIEYHCGPADYLERARSLLSDPSPEQLFYASFELRCFVESRQDQYLRAQEAYRQSLPKRWKIGLQARELNRIYRETRAQRMLWELESGPPIRFLYVPVSEELKRDAELLGELLHSRQEALTLQNIEDLKARLSTVFARAEVCASGNLQCPAFKPANVAGPVGSIQGTISSEDAGRLKALAEGASRFVMHVEYFDVETIWGEFF